MAKILIADDEPNILMLTSVLFKSMGLEVHTAVNGKDALEKAKSISPDIVITDVIMPELDGFGVCQGIRNIPELANIPIIILSAMGDEYNKITGFEGGADDYVTKPFNVEELKARVKVLLSRYHRKPLPSTTSTSSTEPVSIEQEPAFETISTGHEELDQSLGGGLPKGSNILVIGPLGQGKSSFARKFLLSGLANGERSLFIALDDSPSKIRGKLLAENNFPISEHEETGILRFVDAYSWSSFAQVQNEPFAINGILELNQLSGVISDAGYELGQTIQSKLGGRRVIDSISSLLINFELSSVQRFINQIARTALAFGGVTTLFLIEDGTVSDQVINNMKYIMDGVIEFGNLDGKKAARIASMKWTNFDSSWKML